LHFSPLPSQLARIELAAMGNVDQHQDGLPRRAPSAHGCVNTARGQNPTYPGAANAWARLWRDGQADPGEHLITEGIVCHSLAISSLAVLQPRLESVLQVLSIAASLPCAPGRRRPASVIGLPMPTFCFPLPDTIYWHGLNFFSFSASTTPAIRPTASTPSSLDRRGIRAAAVSGGLVLALTGGAISGWVVGARTGAGGMRSFLRRPFCGGRPGSSEPPRYPVARNRRGGDGGGLGFMEAREDSNRDLDIVPVNQCNTAFPLGAGRCASSMSRTTAAALTR
jgi:hypothetical protein